ncbi:Hypothetical_protein [Hexamita inflata]|uniref:Hypothetical_protein n=1 Tax=Hexamita inflata TaxID=28002 RepID=A0ABP1KFJ3_9EUKA
MIGSHKIKLKTIKLLKSSFPFGKYFNTKEEIWYSPHKQQLEANFEYMQDIISNVTCVNCNQPFKLNVYRDDSMKHCLKCGQYFHQNYDHYCVKLAYNFLDNLLFTNKYGMLDPYKNQFGGLQRLCVGPELFQDQKLLSQVVCYVITAEASLQRDENWVAYVAY